MDQDNLDARLRELETFSFHRPTEPDEDPTGRLAYRAMCEKIDKQTNEFYRFPITSVVDKLDRTDVNLSHCGIGDKGAQALAETIKINTSITALDLTDNHLTIAGGEPIIHALIPNKSIRTLNLADNLLGHQAALAAARTTLGLMMKDLLTKNDTIADLSLKGNRIADKDMDLIAETADYAYVTRLDLSYNELGPRGAAAVATFISSSSRLVEVHLGWNRFQRVGSLAVLREGLSLTGTVRKFSMPWCGVSDDGGEALGEILKGSSVLEEVDVSNNRIGPKGAEAIARGIAENSSLTRLLLAHNPLHNDGRESILKALKDNTSLVLCDMQFTGVGKVDHQSLTELIKLRPQLEPRLTPQANPTALSNNSQEDHGHQFPVHDGWFKVL